MAYIPSTNMTSTETGYIPIDPSGGVTVIEPIIPVVLKDIMTEYMPAVADILASAWHPAYYYVFANVL